MRADRRSLHFAERSSSDGSGLDDGLKNNDPASLHRRMGNQSLRGAVCVYQEWVFSRSA
jgi:hypothetical protein